MYIAVAILSIGITALAAPLIVRFARRWAGYLLAVVPAASAIYFASSLNAVAAGDITRTSVVWSAPLGIALSFRADGLSLLMALLISGIGALVAIYAQGYMGDHPQLGRFYTWLMIFMAAMLGVVLSDHLLLLFVFWELTSISSFMLIGFNHKESDSRYAALQALLVTGGGGLALLAGLVLLGTMGGSMELSVLLSSNQTLSQHALYLPALILILLGAFTKSAQFPFHFWLPSAMAAPTPVSAYLHSATMVKAGIYLMARLSPVMGGTPEWTAALTVFGGITMALGAIIAVSQTDLKKLLAYSTISTLGALTLLIGMGTTLAFKAAAVLLLAHGLYKGALFLVAGAVDHATGTRDVRKLGGLWADLRPVAIAAAIAAVSMAGIPPLFGFISKELTYEAALDAGVVWTIFMVAAFILTVYVAGVVGIAPFWGKRIHVTPEPHDEHHADHHAHGASFSLWIGPAILAGLSLLLGLFPEIVSSSLFTPAASAIAGTAVSVKLSLWHGVNPALILSIITLIAGAALYVWRGAVRNIAMRLTPGWNAGAVYDAIVNGIVSFAGALTHIMQSGYLRYYLMVTVLTAVIIIGVALFRAGGIRIPADDGGLELQEILPAVMIVLGALLAVTTRSRLTAVAGLGLTGYGVAVMYLLFSAPDLAITQFLIESLTLFLFVLAFYYLPRFANFSSPGARVRDIVIALLVGGMMTSLVLTSAGVQLFPSITPYYLETSLPLGHGRNVTNVILVDFRAFDTLGEVTVLSIAAVGVFALLKLWRRRQS